MVSQYPGDSLLAEEDIPAHKRSPFKESQVSHKSLKHRFWYITPETTLNLVTGIRGGPLVPTNAKCGMPHVAPSLTDT